jgi:nicotinamide-nucleotide amidase
VWLAWACGEHVYARRFQFSGDRQAVRERSVEAALVGLIRLVSGENPIEG